jgi:hypothetical protein
MTVYWSYNGIRIYVQDRTLDWDSITARLNPLAGGTVFHHFGHDERIDKVTAVVVGGTNLLNLAQCTEDDAFYELVTPYGNAEFKLKHMTARQRKGICQTIDPTLDEDESVWDVDLELWYDFESQT